MRRGKAGTDGCMKTKQQCRLKIKDRSTIKANTSYCHFMFMSLELEELAKILTSSLENHMFLYLKPPENSKKK